jgi:hypothetical protein
MNLHFNSLTLMQATGDAFVRFQIRKPGEATGKKQLKSSAGIKNIGKFTPSMILHCDSKAIFP